MFYYDYAWLPIASRLIPLWFLGSGTASYDSPMVPLWCPYAFRTVAVCLYGRLGCPYAFPNGYRKHTKTVWGDDTESMVGIMGNHKETVGEA